MMSPRPIRVLCVVPRGITGRGGIETLFAHVDEQLRSGPDTGLEMVFMDSRGGASRAGWIFYFPFALAHYVWLLASRRYDIVHLNTTTNASAWRKWLLQSIAGLAGVKTVVHFHSSFLPKPGEPRGVWVSVLRRVFERAGAVVVLGEYWRTFVARFYDMPAERFQVVANGVVDFAPAAPQAREEGAPVRLLFAGNLTDAKGAGVLLQSLALLPPELPKWHAVLAGAGDVAAFRDRATELGIAGEVEFTGWMVRDTILPLYRQTDIVVLPSRSEGLPVCLLEGACAGAALVSTPVGSIADVLHDGENGLMVMPDDPDALAHALAQLIGDAARREAFRTASRSIYASRFQLEAMIGALREVYQKVLASR
jgi:glycosyltransferase involved in cell wall biosynthesis